MWILIIMFSLVIFLSFVTESAEKPCNFEQTHQRWLFLHVHAFSHDRHRDFGGHHIPIDQILVIQTFVCRVWNLFSIITPMQESFFIFLSPSRFFILCVKLLSCSKNFVNLQVIYLIGTYWLFITSYMLLRQWMYHICYSDSGVSVRYRHEYM